MYSNLKGCYLNKKQMVNTSSNSCPGRYILSDGKYVAYYRSRKVKLWIEHSNCTLNRWCVSARAYSVCSASVNGLSVEVRAATSWYVYFDWSIQTRRNISGDRFCTDRSKFFCIQNAYASEHLIQVFSNELELLNSQKIHYLQAE